MAIDRRRFLSSTALGLTAAALAARCGMAGTPARPTADPPSAGDVASGDRWDDVRAQFRLSPDYVHLSALLIASHPEAVRGAIERYRDEIDADPVLTLREQNRERTAAVREAAADYLGVRAGDIALTDSTTMGLGLVYNGLRLRAGQEILTSDKDYYVTHEAVRQAASRSGATSRQFPLYDDIADVTEDALVSRVREAIRPETRVLALTWVHSSTGLKLPLAAIADAVADVNRGRGDDDRVLLSIDGVHGFGIEEVNPGRLGIDFFSAGCHKWLFGPRGTGILWASTRGWAAVKPSIPSFIDDGVWSAWLTGEEPEGQTTAARMTPGGFKAFEHLWAVTEAFEFHQEIGPRAVAERTHELNRQMKEGLAAMDHVTLVTPMAEELSAGLVCFDVDGRSPWDVVEHLRARHIIASVTPYAVRHARVSPSIRNTPREIELALDAVRSMKG
jgi:isopenicillin-N epimerase